MDNYGCFAIASLFVVFLIGFTFGIIIGVETIRGNAIDAGVAKYSINEKTGKSSFNWVVINGEKEKE